MDEKSLEDRLPVHIKRCIEQQGVIYGLQQGCVWYCSVVEKCPYKRPSEAYKLSYCGKQVRK